MGDLIVCKDLKTEITLLERIPIKGGFNTQPGPGSLTIVDSR